MQEPRTWGEPDVKIDPITSPKPSNAQLANGINQLHACFEDQRKVQKKNVASVTAEVGAVKEDVGKIKVALGLTEEVKKPSGLSSPFEAWRRTFTATVSSVVALFFVYKLLIAIGPAVWDVLKAIDHAIRTGVL